MESGHSSHQGGDATLASYDDLMFFRVMLDCQPKAATAASKPFITVKFVDAVDEPDAVRIAVERTMALMNEKGFDAREIAAYQFAPEEIGLFDPTQAEFEVEGSFIYYLDQ